MNVSEIEYLCLKISTCQTMFDILYEDVLSTQLANINKVEVKDSAVIYTYAASFLNLTLLRIGTVNCQ